MPQLTHWGTARAPVREHDRPQRWVTIGSVYEDEQGRLCIKVDTLPRDPSSWTGWINVYRKGERNAEQE